MQNNVKTDRIQTPDQQQDHELQQITKAVISSRLHLHFYLRMFQQKDHCADQFKISIGVFVLCYGFCVHTQKL